MTSLDNTNFVRSHMPSLFSIIRAEFLKLFAFRALLVAYIMIPAAATLFVFTTYYDEDVRSTMIHANAIQWAVYHFKSCWAILFFQIFLASFTAFMLLMDNQNGMLRMILTQPISRFNYICGKLAGLLLHVTIFCLELVLNCLLTSFIMVGAKGISSADLLSFSLMLAYCLIFILSLVSFVAGVCLTRRTIASGILAGLGSLAGFALLTILAPNALKPYSLICYFLFMFKPVANFEALVNMAEFNRSLFVPLFLAVCLLTPLCTLIPSGLYFCRRDITE